VAQDQLTPRCGCCAHIDVSQRDRGEAGVGLEQQGALAENAVGRDAVQGDRAGRRGRGLPDEGNAVLGTAAAARDCHIRERGDAVERIERHVVGIRYVRGVVARHGHVREREVRPDVRRRAARVVAEPGVCVARDGRSGDAQAAERRYSRRDSQARTAVERDGRVGDHHIGDRSRVVERNAMAPVLSRSHVVQGDVRHRARAIQQHARTEIVSARRACDRQIGDGERRADRAAARHGDHRRAGNGRGDRGEGLPRTLQGEALVDSHIFGVRSRTNIDGVTCGRSVDSCLDRGVIATTCTDGTSRAAIRRGFRMKCKT